MVVIVPNSLSLGLSLGLSGPTGGELTPGKRRRAVQAYPGNVLRAPPSVRRVRTLAARAYLVNIPTRAVSRLYPRPKRERARRFHFASTAPHHPFPSPQMRAEGLLGLNTPTSFLQTRNGGNLLSVFADPPLPKRETKRGYFFSFHSFSLSANPHFPNPHPYALYLLVTGCIYSVN